MELLSAAWDDRLDESSCKRLEELLARDHFAGVPVLIEFTRMHMDLEWLASSKAAHRKALDAVARARAESTWFRRLTAKRIAGLAAAILLVVVGAWQAASWKSKSFNAHVLGDASGTPMVRPPLPVGRIIGRAGVQWGDGRQLQDGQTLLEGQVIDLVGGTARISMDVGAEVVLQSPCRATLISREMVTLENGAIAVKIASWATGFKVRTNDLLVTDIGTRFMVQAHARAASEVHVLDGAVIASSLNQSSSSRRVGALQAVRVNAEGVLESVAFRRETFIAALEPFRPLRPIGLRNTGVGLQAGEKDQHWLIKAGDAHFGPYPQLATVSEAAARYGDNERASSQWISVKDGTTSGVPVRTKYTFETTFDLTDFDANSVRITGLVLADNGVEEIRLNGRPLPIAPWHDWYANVSFFAFHTIEITSGFVPGKNVLSFVVDNDTDLASPEEDAEAPNTPNPMALRVEWRGSGRPR